jgi:hypothetical protein
LVYGRAVDITDDDAYAQYIHNCIYGGVTMISTLPMDRAVAPVTVTQVSLPADARALSGLSRIDYTDAFVVDAGVEHTPEEWMRVVLGDAPLAVRARLVAGWTALGLKLGAPWTGHRVLGWTVRRSDPEVLLLAAGSRLGLQGELLVRHEPDGLLFATIVQLHNPATRALWARITDYHQHVVQSLLVHAVRREGRRGDAAGAK